MKVSDFLKENSDACEQARKWLEDNNIVEMSDAWEICPRGDWMWWGLRRMGIKKSVSMKFARFCANRAKKHAADADAYDAYDAYDAAAYDAAAYDADAYAYAAAAAAYAYAAAAYAAAYVDAYVDAAAAERQVQADWLREHIKNPFGK
jgi:hypothetical protein